jgi:hypothetical protein
VRSNFVSWGKTFAVVLCGVLLVTTVAWCKEKEKASEKVVDSGSFGVFNRGQRVATETFSIKQGPEGSVISSQFKAAQGEQNAEQSSELLLAPSGDLRSYEWKEVSPEKMSATITPNDAFLVERYASSPQDKQQTQNFLLPPSTTILDDYFFVQREVLAWKYFATACKHDQGPLQCPFQKVPFGILNPHARASASVSIEFTGREKLTVRGSERELSHFVLRSEMGDWGFWLDDQLKLVRLLDDSGTEVVRD